MLAASDKLGSFSYLMFENIVNVTILVTITKITTFTHSVNQLSLSEAAMMVETFQFNSNKALPKDVL